MVLLGKGGATGGPFERFDNSVGKSEDGILIEVVVGCLGIESILVLILRWWSDLMVDILRIGWHLGVVVLRRRWSFVGFGSILGILGSQIYNHRILSRCRWLVLS